ncbi:hypothetical protein TMM008_05350 [Pseudomonas sp. 008]|nr:hypothetical protein TMM008_05350 [Pseudomonas sp. 008]
MEFFYVALAAKKALDERHQCPSCFMQMQDYWYFALSLSTAGFSRLTNSKAELAVVPLRGH